MSTDTRKGRQKKTYTESLDYSFPVSEIAFGSESSELGDLDVTPRSVVDPWVVLLKPLDLAFDGRASRDLFNSLSVEHVRKVVKTGTHDESDLLPVE